MIESIHVTIDRDECIACGACWETCPDVFEMGEDDHSQVVAAYRIDDNLAAGQIPVALRECAIQAADGCPVEIIGID